MQVIKEDGKSVIKCECGFLIYKEGVLRMRVAIISNGYICIKCPKCKRMEDSVSMKVLTE